VWGRTSARSPDSCAGCTPGARPAPRPRSRAAAAIRARRVHGGKQRSPGSRLRVHGRAAGRARRIAAEAPDLLARERILLPGPRRRAPVFYDPGLAARPRAAGRGAAPAQSSAPRARLRHPPEACQPRCGLGALRRAAITQLSATNSPRVSSWLHASLAFDSASSANQRALSRWLRLVGADLGVFGGCAGALRHTERLQRAGFALVDTTAELVHPWPGGSLRAGWPGPSAWPAITSRSLLAALGVGAGEPASSMS
jgi:hypothetical protein